MAKEYKYKVDKSFIDFNGHLAEFGYYYYGVDGLRKLCGDNGCSPKLYEELKIGPINSQTTVSFKEEVRENSMIIVTPRITSISEDCKSGLANLIFCMQHTNFALQSSVTELSWTT